MNSTSTTGRSFQAGVTIAFSLMVALFTVACGSSKVLTAGKTIYYRETIYNVSTTKIFTRKNEAILSDKSTVNLADMDKKRFNALLDQHGGELFVRQSFMLDDQELVYQAQEVDS